MRSVGVAKSLTLALFLVVGAISGGCDPNPDDEVVDDTTGPNPYVRAGGIAVTDLAKATKFFTDIMEMTVESKVTLSDRTETTLYATEARKGSRVVLTKFNDGRNTRNIPAKFVFYVPDLSARVARANAAGYATVAGMAIPFIETQVTGPEGYVIEMITGAETETPYLVALGFAVSDLDASTRFYAEALGMEGTSTYNLGALNEQTMEYPTGGGAGLVLQNYTSGNYNTKDNPVKHVSYVPDVNEYAEKVVAAGGTIVSPAAAMPGHGGKLGVVAEDRDGYVIELVQMDE